MTLRDLFLRIRALVVRHRVESELDEELSFHIERETQKHITAGLSPTDARARALARFGPVALAADRCRDARGTRFIDDLARDIRYALRTFRRAPLAALTIVVTVALGIGANTAIFSVLNGVLIRPLPYPEPDALVGVFNTVVIQEKRFEDAGLSPGMYGALKDDSRAFASFGVWSSGPATVTGLGHPEQILSVIATQRVLPALGVQAHLGRWFSTEDDSPGSLDTVIFSYGYWQRQFGGNPDVLGRTIVIDFIPRQVIGVMPQHFRFVNLSPDVFLPQRFSTSRLRPDVFSYNGIARLKPGVTVAAANEDTARVWKMWGENDRVGNMLEQWHITPNVRPLKDDVVGDVSTVLTVLMGALGLVLLLVCTNVANLLLVHAQARRQEFAIRAALGAGWGRIARELLVESLTLGVLGGMLGLGLGYMGLRLLITEGPANLPRLGEISVDATVLVFVLACSLALSLVFGLIAVLKCGIPGRLENARGATPGVAQLRTQNALVVTQVALALVLLVASGLMIRTFLALRAVTPGFTQPERIQTARISIPDTLAPEPERVIRMQAQMLERVAALPGVTAAGFASDLPLDEYRSGMPVGVEGKTALDQTPPNRVVKNISPGLFAAQGTRLVAGRDFTWEDVFGQRHVAAVSESMARETWGEPRQALGKRIQIGRDGPWTEVVGVVENVYEDGVHRPAPAIVYLRAGVVPPVRPGVSAAVRRSVTFAIRSERASTQAFLREVTTAINAVHPDVPLAQVRTLNDVYRLSTARTSFALVLLGITGAMALTLAIVGVYGVLAYAVALRRREVSIRLALGAQPSVVTSSFVRQGLNLAWIGGAIGLASAAGLSRWISSLLFGISPLDPLTYLASGMIIVVAAMAASYVPARQAASVDPMDTLRGD
jgi:putative ABC transport system permease protein